MPRGINVSNGASQSHVRSFSTHLVSTYIRGFLALEFLHPLLTPVSSPFPLPVSLVLAVCRRYLFLFSTHPCTSIVRATLVATDTVPLLCDYCFKSSSVQQASPSLLC
jgi:hypothetical protein